MRLSRLGIAAGVISAPAKGSSSSTTTTSTASTTTTTSGSSTAVKTTYGLGLAATALGPLNISTKTGADLARSQLLTVLSNIQNIYQKSNATPSSPTNSAVGNNTGTVSATTTAQLASYNLALSLLGTSSSDAINNIATIVAGGSVGSAGSSADDSAASILGLFN